MKSAFSLVFRSLAVGAMLAAAGCGGDNQALAPETDDPSYREGQQLEKQGRTDEALAAYLKVIAKRGEQAPESHLDAGLIYLEHREDPISAIYHFKMYLEWEPNSPVAGKVRGLIDRAKLEFARTLPAEPLESQSVRLEMQDDLDRLRQENAELQAENEALRRGSQAGSMGMPQPSSSGSQSFFAPEPAAVSPVAVSPTPAAPAPAENPEPAARPESPPPKPAGRTHTVVRGDTLYNLAKKYYGTASAAKARAIYEANQDVMKSVKDLRPGMVLKIP